MRFKAKATNPDNIEFTITMTAPLKEWRELREQLSATWPSASLKGSLFDLLFQAEKQFDARSE